MILLGVCRLPGLIESVLRIQPMGGAGLQIYIQIYNGIFLFILASVAYGVGSCIAGRTARIPLVADAADAQSAMTFDTSWFFVRVMCMVLYLFVCVCVCVCVCMRICAHNDEGESMHAKYKKTQKTNKHSSMYSL